MHAFLFYVFVCIHVRVWACTFSLPWVHLWLCRMQFQCGQHAETVHLSDAAAGKTGLWAREGEAPAFLYDIASLCQCAVCSLILSLSLSLALSLSLPLSVWPCIPVLVCSLFFDLPPPPPPFSLSPTSSLPLSPSPISPFLSLVSLSHCAVCSLILFSLSLFFSLFALSLSVSPSLTLPLSPSLSLAPPPPSLAQCCYHMVNLYL